jgi:hypothetical protein
MGNLKPGGGEAKLSSRQKLIHENDERHCPIDKVPESGCPI